jgi:cytochrome P450
MPACPHPLDPPFYQSPAHSPSLLELFSRGISDPASTIPASVYHERALKLSRAGPLVVSHPDSVRTVLLDKGDTFGRNRQLRLLMRRAWGDGLAGVEGEPWEHQRRAAAPAFRPQSVEAAVSEMAAAARRGSQGWSDGEKIDVLPAMALIVTDVIMATLLSGLEDPDLEAIAADMRPIALEVTTFGALDVLPLPERLINRLRGLGRSEEETRLRAVAAKLARLSAPSTNGERHLPTLLRQAGPLESNMLGFMIAALETTALGAAWALYLLARYPDWQEALRKEASESRGGDGAGGGLLARQVAQEALRLYPPAPLLARAVIRRTTLEGYRLWPGQTVLIPIYAIHRHRLLWENPDGFDPSRFSPSCEYNRNAYLPFGAGPRLCIAATFALTEIAVILSSLVRDFSFLPAGADPLVSLKVGTHSLNGLHVTAKRLRAPGHGEQGEESLASAEQ